MAETSTTRQVVFATATTEAPHAVLLYSILFILLQQATRARFGDVCLLLVKSAVMGFHDFVGVLLNFLE
jgi:hypothetical protein